MNVDFEIRDCGEGRGKGVFALRPFRSGDKILVERPVIVISEEIDPFLSVTLEYNKLPDSIKAAVDDLYKLPLDHFVRVFNLPPRELKRFSDKPYQLAFLSNRFAEGLFITASRFNHSCLANCELHFIDDFNVGIISALTDIEKDDELTISYVGFYDDLIRDPDMIYKKWGFKCKCKRCTDNLTHQKVVELIEKESAHKEILSVVKNNPALLKADMHEKSYHLGEEIIKICEELKCCSRKHKIDTYFRMGVNCCSMHDFENALDCMNKSLLLQNESHGGSKKTIKSIKEKENYRDLILDYINEKL